MIVENGLSLDNANSYVDLDFANDYFSTRNVTQWEDLEESEKEVLLIKATDYIDNAYEWKGKKKLQTQSLKFPRKDIYDIDGYEVTDIPLSVKQSVCESCILILNNKTLFKTENENGKVSSERIGELSFTYITSDKEKGQSLYEVLNLRLNGLYKDKTQKRIYSGKVERV